jgi:hypothetical protein
MLFEECARMGHRVVRLDGMHNEFHPAFD